MYLHSLEQKRKEAEQADKTAAQFIQAASLKPRRARARYMSTQFDGPSARRDSEEAERNRWIFTLSENIKGTATPMGKMLTDRPGQQLVRQASLNPQVPCEGSPKVFVIPHTQQGTELSHVVRPTVRVPSSETLGTVQQGSFAGDPLEFCLSQRNGRDPGTRAIDRISSLWSDLSRPPGISSTRKAHQKRRRASSPPCCFFLEQLVMNETSPIYLHVCSWWMLVQNWATLRFSDHRGLNPSEVAFREGSFHARLTRSKTIGQDKTITSKPLVIDACCFLSHREWLTRS